VPLTTARRMCRSLSGGRGTHSRVWLIAAHSGKRLRTSAVRGTKNSAYCRCPSPENVPWRHRQSPQAQTARRVPNSLKRPNVRHPPARAYLIPGYCCAPLRARQARVSLDSICVTEVKPGNRDRLLNTFRWRAWSGAGSGPVGGAHGMPPCGRGSARAVFMLPESCRECSHLRQEVRRSIPMSDLCRQARRTGHLCCRE
jgi:hypothetical protein